MPIDWIYQPYDGLSPKQIHDLFAARQAVFVVEQNCVYQDVDGYDVDASHLIGSINNDLAAYARILSPATKYKEPSIGRILTTAEYRRLGIGEKLVEQAIVKCQKQFGERPIRIGAQRYLESFYQRLGFKIVGDEYDEDGIPHVEMLFG